MKLSEQQVRFFKTFGYLGIPKLFSTEEIARITEQFEQTIQKLGGKNHDGSRRTMIGGPIEHTPFMCALLDDPRIKGIVGGVIGDDFSYCGGDGNYYSGDTPWHPDGNHNILTPVKVAFYLDPVGPDTGCLRVLPGSFEKEHSIHRWQIGMNDSQNLFGVAPRDFPGNVPLVSAPGDVVMFNHDTWHAAFGGSNRRRMFTLNCHRRARTPEEFAALRTWIMQHAFADGARFVGMPRQMYTDTMLGTASDERRTHLEQALQTYDECYLELERKAAGAKVSEKGALAAV